MALGQTLLAQYVYRYDRRRRRLSAVWQPQLYRTEFASPQLELWELDDDQWRKVLERSGWQHLKRPGVEAQLQQLSLPMPATEMAS